MDGNGVQLEEADPEFTVKQIAARMGTDEHDQGVGVTSYRLDGPDFIL